MIASSTCEAIRSRCVRRDRQAGCSTNRLGSENCATMATTSAATIHQRCSPSVARSQAGLLSAVPKASVRAPAGCSAMMRIVLARPSGTGRTRVHHHLSWLEAGVVGAMQGVAELFPVSSLGHSVLLPAVVGGSWARDLNVRTPESPYLV